MHVLISGWFSFTDMGATAGDLIARDLVCNWLTEAGISYNVAISPQFPLENGLYWEDADPQAYSDVIFVCGPFGNGWPVTEFLARFSNSRLIGLNLSLMEPLAAWNPFFLLFERDSSSAIHPDITFYAPAPAVPVVGVILAHKQKEYGSRSLHDQANLAIEHLLKSKEAVVVHIDTALLKNEGGLRTAGEVEALIAKMDVVITTRLHGTVLALKNEVPVLPIDPIEGGAKISLQVKALEWPILFNVPLLDNTLLTEAFNYCLTPQAKMRANECKLSAIKQIELLRENLVSQLLTVKNTEVLYG